MGDEKWAWFWKEPIFEGSYLGNARCDLVEI